MISNQLLKKEIKVNANTIFIIVRNIIFFLILLSLTKLCTDNIHYLIKDIWKNIIIITFFSFESFLHKEYQLGLIDLYKLNHIPLNNIIFIKTFCHWLKFVAPITTLGSWLIFLNLGNVNLTFLQLFFIMNTITYNFSLINTILSTLTLNTEKKSLIISILAFPIYIPIIIFCAIIIQNIIIINDFQSEKILLIGYTCLLTILSPTLSSIILKQLN